MATVTVLRFPTADGAQGALGLVQSLQHDRLIKIHDAAVASWPVGRPSPKTRQLAEGAMSGMFWGMLLGLIFVRALFGAALDSAFGAWGSAFKDYGIDDDFVRRVRSAVTEGTSALFLITSEAVIERVVDRLSGTNFDIIATNLSTEQEEKLREAFAQS